MTEFPGEVAGQQRKNGTPFFFHTAETEIYRNSQGKGCLVHFNTRFRAAKDQPQEMTCFCAAFPRSKSTSDDAAVRYNNPL